MEQKIIDQISAEIDAKKDEIIQFTLELVKKRSENPPGNETDVAELIKEKGLKADALLIAEPSGINRDFDSLGLACRGVTLVKLLYTVQRCTAVYSIRVDA